jgi:hypothetical protein
MELTVFYAWQNDAPSQLNRFLIRDVLEGASKSIRNDASVEDSPRLDHDTLGVSGTPEITSTIFSTIKQCAVFVADVTLVGASLSMAPSRERKLLPNLCNLGTIILDLRSMIASAVVCRAISQAEKE